MLCLQQKPWPSQGACSRVKEGHGRKTLSDCTGVNWVAVLGLCHRFVHVLGFGGQCPAAVQGCGKSPLHGIWPVGCAPRVAVSDRGQRQK